MLFDDTLLDDGQDEALIQAADQGERQAQHQIQLGGNPLATQRGRFRFVPEPLHERRSQKFGVHERVVRLRPVQEGRLIPQQQLADALTRGLRRAVEQVLDQQKVPDTDRFYISLASDRLRSASNAFHLTAQEWRQNGLRAQTLLDNLSKMLNSNEQFEMDDSFNLSVVHVRPPPRGTGTKRQHVPGHQSNVRLKQMKKSVIEMPRDDAGWCAARAIVTARGLSLAGQDANARKQWIHPRRCVYRRQQAAEALAQEVGLGPGAWGPDELTRVAMAPSLIDYKLVVVDASRTYSLVAYGHGDRLLALLYDDHHYDTLTSLKGFLGRSYLCLVCLKGYDHQGQHRCPRNKGEHCSSCLQTDCDEHKAAYRAYRSPDVLCPHCQRHFYGTACLERHRTRTIDGRPQDQDHRPVCQTRRKCPQCRAYLRGSKAIKDHRCGHAQFHACQQYVDIESHQCFIQVRTLDDDDDDDTVQPPVHVFFDIEAKQVDSRHVPNLLVCQRADDDVFHWWYGDACVQEFLLQLEDWCQGGKQPLTVLAHNFQGYDSYPVIDTLHQLRLKLGQIRNGGKVLQLQCLASSVRFIDSMSFFQMKLAKFPKTFGLTELKKGYFPHLFNTDDHQTYVGSLPDQHYYMPDGMSVDDRDAFRRWHDKLTREGYVFDFRHELLEYCKSDVLLLKQGCMTFKREFEAKAGFDPFDQMTIASACNRYLRTHCLQPNTIACEPLLGWGGRRVNQSSAAFEWLAWEAHLVSTPLRHAHNGGEVRPLPDRRYTVDGFDARTQTVYEFDGCFWHGCPTCFPQRHESHPRLLGRTMDDVFALRQEKHDLLRQHGYLVRSIWECEWSRRRAADPAIQTFLQSHQTPLPLDPRDAFFGGRTNAYQLYRCVEGDERILYYDFKSLYPYVNKYCRYPIGHPQIISQPTVEQGLDAYFGLVCCTILPPTDLLHPVLPYRCSQKLTFPLCATCVRQYIDVPLLDKHVDDCHHTDAQRALTGTWCTPELVVALQKGYRLLHIHQVYHFPDTQVGLFAEYIDTWLKLKEEASGYPEHCTTGHLQREHVRRWNERENIVLHHANIRKNPGQRALSKLMLNSMWGKFGQQTNKTQVKEFIDPPDFWQFLDSSAHDVRWVSPVTEERVEIHYKMQHHCESDSPNLNIFVACFTTCHARLHLYRALDHLGPRVLYSDTDSVVFVQRPDDPPIQPPLGDFLGDFTDELDPGDHIIEFCSGGPKNYGYMTALGNTECKVRGFSLNAEGQAQLNYQVLKQNTLDELRRPQAQPRVTPVVQTHSVHRDAKQYQLSTRSRTKDYKLVYNKRILDPRTFYTFPYGYRTQDHQNTLLLLDM
ncbi:uncharacterized protein [Acropora muricata]|uniref:uncharacterized protein n=1 Tax=Acropora muricata TaxID=159855 RepID=UPI0034E3DE95